MDYNFTSNFLTIEIRSVAAGCVISVKSLRDPDRSSISDTLNMDQLYDLLGVLDFCKEDIREYINAQQRKI